MDVQTTETAQKKAGAMANNEAEVQQLFNNFTKSFQSAKLDEIMSFYAPDVVAFDLMPPLQFVGRDAYRKSWEQATNMMQAPWKYQSRDLKISAGDDVAFSHCLAEVGGTSKDGKMETAWVRHTIGYRKINGKWMIAHEQMSAPIDMANGKALLNLNPEQPMSH